MSAIKQEARNRQAQVVLFGHTHLPVTAYDDGLYLLNPGSLQLANGTYGILEITEAGITMNIEQM